MAKKETYVATILDELRKGNVERGKVLAKLGKQWQMPARTFDRYWKQAQEQHKILTEAIEHRKDEATTEQALKDVSNGLKSKSQRMDNIQKQITDLENILESGITDDTIIDKGEATDIKRPITAVERATITRAIVSLNAELNKMDGSYAPTQTNNKNENSGKIIVVRE
jgi:hypothetical protein